MSSYSLSGALSALNRMGLSPKGTKLAATDEDIEANARRVALMHALPVPFSTLAAMGYQGYTSPDEHYIARPLSTALGAGAGSLAGGVLAGGLAAALSSPEALKALSRHGQLSPGMLMALMAGTAGGSYLGAKSVQDAWNE